MRQAASCWPAPEAPPADEARSLIARGDRARLSVRFRQSGGRPGAPDHAPPRSADPRRAAARARRAAARARRAAADPHTSVPGAGCHHCGPSGASHGRSDRPGRWL